MDIKNTDIHGVTNEMALSGMNIINLLEEIDKDIKTYNVKRLVAHNIDFDMNILLSECYRYNKESLANLLISCETFCTMKRGKIFMDFYKNPKLIELYNFVHRNNGPPFKEHSALSDCVACEKCYLAINSL
jgi:DNA polymerase III epsilon subunit-like protein